MNIILSFSVAAFCTIQTITCDDTLVKVQQGWLQGKVQDSVFGNTKFISFENIPYAKAPIGQLRFKAPEEAEPWDGTRDATALGPMCPQYNPLTDILNAGSEDCLTCNVYTPDIKGNLPVIVFFSGFAYSFDGDVPGLYGPDYLVENAVIVKCNYRLDAFGFLYLGIEDVPGNAGLKDQVLSLIWVHNNIEAFGGDPNSVTLAGISSGSASIYHHMMSPMSTDLFHRAIMMSGVPFCDAIYPHEVLEQSFYLGKKFGLETSDANTLLTQLQDIPYEQLINSSYSLAKEYDITNQLFKKMSTFVPVVEEDFGQERFIVEDPMTSIDSAPLNPVPLLIGYCDKEALIIVKESEEYLINLYNDNPILFAPNKLLYKITKADVVEQIANDIKNHYFVNKEVSVENIKEFIKMDSVLGMIYETIKFAKKMSQFTDTVYLFEFKSTSNRNVYGREGLKYGIKGAAHGDLLPYMFPLAPLNMTVDIDSKEHALIKQFVGPMMNFATHGNPSYNANFSWPKFTTVSLDYIEFSDQVTTKQDPFSKDVQFLDNIYDKYKY